TRSTHGSRRPPPPSAACRGPRRPLLTLPPASAVEPALPHVKTPPPCCSSRPKSANTPCFRKDSRSETDGCSKWSARWTKKVSETAATPSHVKPHAPKKSPPTGFSDSTANTCALRSSRAKNKRAYSATTHRTKPRIFWALPVFAPRLKPQIRATLHHQSSICFAWFDRSDPRTTVPNRCTIAWRRTTNHLRAEQRARLHQSMTPQSSQQRIRRKS